MSLDLIQPCLGGPAHLRTSGRLARGDVVAPSSDDPDDPNELETDTGPALSSTAGPVQGETGGNSVISAPGPSRHAYTSARTKRAKRSHTDRGEAASDGEKRLRLSTQLDATGTQYGCPFRMRNPLRFNPRDHPVCASQPYPNLPALKRHVRNFHRRKANSCQRCHESFETPAELERHLQALPEALCQFVPRALVNDVENGVHPECIELLNERKQASKVDSWRALWNMLFPADRDIPHPDFEPVVDVKELQATSRLDWLWEQVLTEHLLPGLCDDPKRRVDILRCSKSAMRSGFQAIVTSMISERLSPSMMRTAEGMRSSEAPAMAESEGPNETASNHPDTPSGQNVSMAPTISKFESACQTQMGQADTHPGGQEEIGLLPENDNFIDGISVYGDYPLPQEWS